MATKTEYELSEPRKALVKSEEVLNQMKEQGLLQPFTDYYTPEDGGGETNSKFELLWTNPNPTTQFTAQTISLDFTSYNFAIILIGFSTSYPNARGTNVVVKDKLTALTVYNKYRRGCTVNNNSVSFDDGYNDNALGNGYAVPQYIYGVKI